MNRYSKGQIYKIVDVGYNMCYIGSTTEPLSKRMERHRKYYKRYLETGRVDTRVRLIFDKYGVENCKIVLITDYPCNNKQELQRKEGEYIQSMECVNKCVAGRRPEEYKEHYKERYKQQRKERYENNKEYIIKQNKEYREQHKEQIAQKRKEHYERNIDRINEQNKQYYYQNFDKIKEQTAQYAQNNKEFLAKINREWYDANKDYVCQKGREYYEKHKEMIISKKKEKVECECGSVVRIHSIRRHEKSQKHQDWLKQQGE